MVRWEFQPECHVRPSSGGGACAWDAWLEAAVLMRATVAAWEYADEVWLHWAVRLDVAGAPEGDVRGFDPGRYARAAGRPPGGAHHRSPIVLDEAMARGWVSGRVAAWRPVVHRHAELGIVSRLDESADEFRKRCLAPLRPALRSGGVAAVAVAERLGDLARGIETLRFEPGHHELRCARVAVVWYPAGTAPACAGGDAMVTGAPRGRR